MGTALSERPDLIPCEMAEAAAPGIGDLEDVARRRKPANDLCRELKASLLSESPASIVPAVRALWMAEAYQRRAAFEETAFAEVPAYQILRPFDVSIQLNEQERSSLVSMLTALASGDHVPPVEVARAITALDHALPTFGASNAPIRNAQPWPSHVAAELHRLSALPARFPGSGYSEAPMDAQGVRTFADEYALVKQLAARIEETVVRVADVSGCPRAHGNHAKATVLRASMTVHPNARDEFKELLGLSPMEGGLRFSNSSTELNTVDHKGNLVGMRFSFMTDRGREPFTSSNAEGGWFTLTANSAAKAHVTTPERHVAFTASVGSPHATTADTLRSVVQHANGAGATIRAIGNTLREVVRAIPQGRAVGARPALDELIFHSRHAYRLGAQAVRYFCRVTNPHFPSPPDDWTADPDYRHRDLIRMLKSEAVTVEVYLLILPDFAGADAATRALHMIEDMRADWTAIPGEPFLLIELPRQTVEPTHDRERMVRWFAENPVDLMAAGGPMAPLGAAGRSRTLVYRASQETRSSSPPLGVPLRLLHERGSGTTGTR